MNICGIYYIKCLVNNTYYIGFTKNFKNRFHDHKKFLNRGLCDNKALLEDWKKYGQDSFLFEIIEETDNKEREEYWTIKFRNDGINLYNIKDGNKWSGRKPKGRLKHSEEFKKSQSDKLSGSGNGRNTMNLKKALKIKSMLLEETGENWKQKEIRIAGIIGTSPRMVQRIRWGEHYLSNEIGGGFKQWKENKNDI